jgi:uncharacterized membrane protein YtjA (UPF0391 family)
LTGGWDPQVEGARAVERPWPRAFFVSPEEGLTMLRWALAFLIFALIAAFFGFGGLAAASAGIAKTLFYIFLLVFLVTLILGVVAGKKVL